MRPCALRSFTILFPKGESPFNEGLKSCRWFTRGWTLQELIASRHLRFYDRDWDFRGSKLEAQTTLESITGVPGSVLADTSNTAVYSALMRMSWAAKRNTTREEDEAYCLLGPLDVGMPAIYAEGRKAFRRLQEDIIGQTNDLSVLAWDSTEVGTHITRMMGIQALAGSPRAFEDCDMIQKPLRSEDFSVTRSEFSSITQSCTVGGQKS